MTSQGSAHDRFARALKQRSVFGAEMAMREMGDVSLLDALDYLALLAEVQPEKAGGRRCAGTGGSRRRRRC